MFYLVVYIDKGLGFALPSQGWSGECMAAGVQTLALEYLESGDTGQGCLPVLPGLLICHLKEPLWYGSCPSYKLICGITSKPMGILQLV